MPQTSTTFDAVLKEDYGPQIAKVLNNKVRIRKWLFKSKRPSEGRRVVFPAHVGRNHSFRFQPSGDDLATAGNQQTTEVRITYKTAFGHVRIHEDVMKQSKTKRGAFEYALAFELENAVHDAAVQENRAAWLDGSGKLAEVSSYLAGVVTLKNLSTAAGTGICGNVGNRYIKKGMLLDFYTSGGVARKRGCEVTAVDISADTITISGGTGTDPAVTDGVYLQQPSLGTPIDMDAMGLDGIISNDTTVLFNVNRTTYPVWKGQVLSLGSFAAPGALTERSLQRMEDMLTDAGYGDNYILFSHTSARNEFLQLEFPDRRYEPMKFPAGFEEDKADGSVKTALMFNNAPVIPDRDCPWRRFYFVNKAAIQIFELADVHWIEDDKGAVLRLVTGKAGLFEAQFGHYYNIGVEAMGPNCCGKITDFSVTVDRVENP